MLDPQRLRNETEEIAQNLKSQGTIFDVAAFHELESQRKQIQVETQQLQAQRNQSSKQIGKAKAAGEDIQPLLDAVADLGDQLKAKEAELDTVQTQMHSIVMGLPNTVHESVPAGSDESDNVEIGRSGDIPEMDFTPKDHVAICEARGWLDHDAAAYLSGARFAVLRGPLARLHRALAQFMLDTHTSQHDYEEVNVPILVGADAMTGTGQLPKFADDAFITTDDRYLIPTAEVPVCNLVAQRIVNSDDLPLRMVAHSPCFRREAGSHGKDTRGLIRQHQFEKVELVQVTTPEQSYAALEELLGHAQTILDKLGLAYRTVSLCSGDIGFSAAKTYDIEVWLPGQSTYREISSCSNCEDFQARRMLARYRNAESGKPQYVHTLNGSGLAVGRCMIAVLENYQREDGTVMIPEALQPYMGGITSL